MNEKILFVDDDPNILEGYQRKLGGALSVDTALGAAQGLKAIRDNGPYAVVISDMQMPVMNGIEFLAHVEAESPDTVRMMLTGNADVNTAMEAVNEGHIFRFLTKPCPGDVFGKALVAGISQYRLVTNEKSLLEDTLNGVVELLVEMLSWANPETFGWALHLRGNARFLANIMKVDPWEIELAALLCRIGDVMVPRNTAGSPEGATNGEASRVGSAELASQMLQHIPRLKPVAQIILYSEKNFDGSGFPADNVAGSDLPIGSRILKVLLDLAALESQAIMRHVALAQMQGQAGRYDPQVLKAAAALRIPAYQTLFVSVPGQENANGPTLQEGDVLVEGVRALDGSLLIRAREVVSTSILARLRAFDSLAKIVQPIEVRRVQ
ncbi:MAG: response regulator [FCB group bacterium]|jgi:response regulator RpfG family c-di-GMP phosphodiesterase|nr:response regulator [FCB group bacterium]